MPPRGPSGNEIAANLGAIGLTLFACSVLFNSFPLTVVAAVFCITGLAATR